MVGKQAFPPLGQGACPGGTPGLLLPPGPRFCPLTKGHQEGGRQGSEGHALSTSASLTAQSSLETLILPCVVGRGSRWGDREGQGAEGWRAGARGGVRSTKSGPAPEVSEAARPRGRDASGLEIQARSRWTLDPRLQPPAREASADNLVPIRTPAA